MFSIAVTRPGRFDCLLFVGTPNLASREKRFKQVLSDLSLRLQPDDREQLLSVWRYVTLALYSLQRLPFLFLFDGRFADLSMRPTGRNFASSPSPRTKCSRRVLWKRQCRVCRGGKASWSCSRKRYVGRICRDALACLPFSFHRTTVFR